MHIAFDAKRAMHNRAGLGNYSRNLLLALAKQYPENKYSLYTPKPGTLLDQANQPPFEVVLPGKWGTKFSSVWRSFGMLRTLKAHKPDLYHGLSHEIPFGITKLGIKSVVTIHDLIFERYPQWYNPIDRILYRIKYRYACKAATHIIAIGSQTAADLQKFWKIDPNKIDIIRQSCNARFWEKASETQKLSIKEQYQLPDKFIIQVGTIEARKNHFTSIKALVFDETIPLLLIVGKRTPYFKRLKRFVNRHQLQTRVRFLHHVPNEHLPALYQMAQMALYPSIFEGFGIPVLEALVSGTPVITTNELCFTDAGGDAAVYISPYSPSEMAKAINEIDTKPEYRQSLLNKAQIHIKAFTPEIFAQNTINVYQKVIHKK